MSPVGVNLSFDVSVEDDGWAEMASIMTELSARVASALPDECLPEVCLPEGGLPDESLTAGAQEISLVLTNDASIRRLNRDYRGKDKPTNVLSFPTIEAPGLLGDIVLARETILREAEDKGVSFKHHFTHLIIHGLLHLLGHDHQTEAEAEKMEAIEIAALAKLGIANPYVLKA